MIGDGWNTSCLQAVEHARILDADRHRMPGEPFRIGDNEAIGGVAEGIPKRLDFRLR